MDAPTDDESHTPQAKRLRSSSDDKSAKRSARGGQKRKSIAGEKEKKKKRSGLSEAPPMFVNGVLCNMSPVSPLASGFTTFMDSTFNKTRCMIHDLPDTPLSEVQREEDMSENVAQMLVYLKQRTVKRCVEEVLNGNEWGNIVRSFLNTPAETASSSEQMRSSVEEKPAEHDSSAKMQSYVEEVLDGNEWGNIVRSFLETPAKTASVPRVIVVENNVERCLESRDRAVDAVLIGNDGNREDEHTFNESIEKFAGVLWRPSKSNGVKVYRQLTITGVAGVTLGDVFDREKEFFHVMGCIFNPDTNRVEVHCALFDKARSSYLSDISIFSVQNIAELLNRTSHSSLQAFCDKTEAYECKSLESRLLKKIKGYCFMKRRGRSRNAGSTVVSLSSTQAAITQASAVPASHTSVSAATTSAATTSAAATSATPAPTTKTKNSKQQQPKKATVKATSVMVLKAEGGGGKKSGAKSSPTVQSAAQPVQVNVSLPPSLLMPPIKEELSEWDKHKMNLEKEQARRQHELDAEQARRQHDSEIHARAVEHQKLIHRTALDMAKVLSAIGTSVGRPANEAGASGEDIANHYVMPLATTATAPKRPLMACINLMWSELPIEKEGSASVTIENALNYIADPDLRAECEEMKSNLHRANHIVKFGIGIE